MKIRIDFVTNSSSSSYVTASIKSAMIEDFLNSKGMTLKKLTHLFTFDSGYFEEIGDIDCSKGPAEAIVNCIDYSRRKMDLEDYIYGMLGFDFFDEDANNELSPEDLDSVLTEFRQFLLENSQEINKTIEVQFSHEAMEEGGGDDFFGFMSYYFKDGKGKYARISGASERLGESFPNGSTKYFVNWDELSDEDRDCVYSNCCTRAPSLSNVDEELVDVLRRIAIYQEFDLYESD